MGAMTEEGSKRRCAWETMSVWAYVDKAAAEVAAADAAITISDGWVELRIDGLYGIELSRITDCMCLFGWVLHLIKKPWFTPLHAGRFVKKICGHKGWPVPQTAD